MLSHFGYANVMSEVTINWDTRSRKLSGLVETTQFIVLKKGVHVHFSDDPEEEKAQRDKFTNICPELCELRYLTAEMRGGWTHRAKSRDYLYDHNMAQAIMLVLENKVDDARRIALQALIMAVQRVTNDNTIRYFRWCVFCWIFMIVAGVVGFVMFPSALRFDSTRALETSSSMLGPYVVAGMAGATGAVLSIATRTQAFKLRLCEQSNMNYWMSGVRVGIGAIAGTILLLLATTMMSEAMRQLVSHTIGWDWQAAATLGLLGGFAERLVPNFFRGSLANIEPSIGTPVQAARKEGASQVNLRSALASD